VRCPRSSEALCASCLQPFFLVAPRAPRDVGVRCDIARQPGIASRIELYAKGVPSFTMIDVHGSWKRLLWRMLPLLTTGCGLISGLSDLEIVECNANCDASVVRDGSDRSSGELDASDAAAQSDAPQSESEAPSSDVGFDQVSSRDAIRADESARDTVADADVEAIVAPADSVPYDAGDR
jgi:hypothetical protein